MVLGVGIGERIVGFGGAGGSIDPTSPDALTGFNVVDFGADQTGTNDSSGSINSAIAALNAAGGGILFFPNGTYKINTAPTQITVPCWIMGSGAGIGTDKVSTLLSFATTIRGFSFSSHAQMSRISSIYLKSASTVLGTDDGIVTLARLYGENVVCDGFGRYGFNFDTSSSGNNDDSVLINCRAVSVKSHGFYIHGSNSNLVTLITPQSTSCGGYGIFHDASDITILNHDDEGPSTSGAIYDNGSGATIINPLPDSAGDQIVIDTSSTNGFLLGGTTVKPSNLSYAGTGWWIAIDGTAPVTLGIVRTPFLCTGTGAVTIGSLNTTRIFRVLEGGTISNIAVDIVVSSGNICVQAFRATGAGRSATPGALLASSGSVASPGTGFQSIPLGSTVTLLPGDFIAIGADNATVTFAGANGVGDGNMAQGVCGVIAAFPATASPTVTWQNNRIIEIIGL